MSNPKQLTKKCHWCKKSLNKPPKYSYLQWSVTRYCSQRCTAYGTMKEGTRFLYKKGHAVAHSTRRKIRASHIGMTYDRPKNGWVSSYGYRYIYAPEHPNAGRDGYMHEHRFVMSNYLGRPLLRREIVHHENENKLDNRIANLRVLTVSEHMKLHHSIRSMIHL